MRGPAYDWINAALADVDRRGLRRFLTTRESPQRGDHIVIDGRELVNFGSNDYLGLASSPELLNAAREAIGELGWGSGASPLVTGRSAAHAELERRIAEFEGTEAALVFSTGFAANAGVIPALVRSGDVIFSDEANHASIIDGCRLSGAEIRIYRHVDVEHLATLMSNQQYSGRQLIVTDSIFSMEGDFAPLPEIAALAERHSAMLLVDEAHATGVFGRHGRGLIDQLNLPEVSLIRIGTLSKALGSSGGFVVGSKSLIDWIANRARPYIFSTAMPDIVARVGHAALDLVTRHPEWRAELAQMAGKVRAKLRSDGWNLGRSESQIIPIVFGDPERTMKASQRLRERGFFVPGIRPPSVPAGKSLLRISITRRHSPDDLDALQQALVDIRTVD